MFQQLKVWGLRKYYRNVSARGWKEHAQEVPYSTLQLPGPAGPISTRMYANNAGAQKPLIVYFHGGGWVIGDLETHHPYCQALSSRTGCTVIAVDYRLAPEHRFPAAADDSLAATLWIADHIDELGPSNGQLILAGGSAGANLATCTCLELDASTRTKVVGEILKYPVVDHYLTDWPSYTQRASGQILTRNTMIWFWDIYLGSLDPSDPQAKRAMPIQATTLSSLPSTFLVTAEFDPLRDEGIAYAEQLRAAGVAVQYHHFETAAHDFACSEGPNENFHIFMTELVNWIEQLD